MYFSQSILAAVLAGVAAAAPMPGEMEFLDPRSSSNHLTLAPARHPDVDGQNMNNLFATPGAVMHFDSDPDPSKDSTMATLSAPGAPYPIVMLEDTDFVKSTQCSENQAHIQFSDANAYKQALENWKKQKEFVIISYNKDCGTGLDGKRDFAKVTSVTGDDSAMTVAADIEMISYADAIGESTVVHAAIGNYRAPLQRRIGVHKSLSLKWSEYPTNALSDNQWGPGYELMNSDKLDVICVGCGTKGDLELEGTVDFSILGGFDDAKLSLKGNMEGSLSLGLDAKGLSGTIPIANKGIAQIPIGGVSIPEVITIGPQIDIAVGASITVEATGSLLVGATLNWPSVDMELVLAGDGDNKADGLTPDITPKTEVKGTIEATLDLHLPVSFGIGVNILDGTWNKSVSIVDTPGFQLTGSKSNTGSCSGVGLSADLYNNVNFDILGLKNIALASYTHTLFSTCLGGGAATSAPSTPTPTASRPAPVTTGSPTPTPTSPTVHGKPPATTAKPSHSHKHSTYTSKPAHSTSDDGGDDHTETKSKTYSSSKPAHSSKPSHSSKHEHSATYTTTTSSSSAAYTTSAAASTSSAADTTCTEEGTSVPTYAPPPASTFQTKTIVPKHSQAAVRRMVVA